ncbi:hypothetical protein PZA11_000623 [Diplocarpon coronariae]|uniref:Uncharacterized protein n=1 Tax=Diplocarpon coronariae TaxID=2795749 RepID=A0A218ZHU7_9HELO|nr:hypothetical protein JHW43_009289 [Diplocarpon mali]OWP07568.1 hypothetical protein B2J93_9020 [Marssonina coronariae]
MQFSVVALTLAAMASVAAAGETVTIYACPSTSALPPVSTAGYAAAGVPHPTGVASTGATTPPAPTGSPINYATGAASANGVSALGMIIAGGVALFL